MAHKDLEARRAWRREYERRNRAALTAAQRERRKRYQGTCETCGKPTDGSGGYGKAPKFCAEHAPFAHAKQKPEVIIARIREWNSRFGRPPTAPEWNPAFCRWYARQHPASTYAKRLLAMSEIVVAEGFPRANTVALRFGSFKAGLRAAGFEPASPGRKRKVAA